MSDNRLLSYRPSSGLNFAKISTQSLMEDIGQTSDDNNGDDDNVDGTNDVFDPLELNNLIKSLQNILINSIKKKVFHQDIFKCSLH